MEQQQRCFGFTYKERSAPSAATSALPSQSVQLVSEAFFENYNPQQHGTDQRKFEVAKARNPFDPKVALPTPIRGFQDLQQHSKNNEAALKMQGQKMEVLNYSIGLSPSNTQKITKQSFII